MFIFSSSKGSLAIYSLSSLFFLEGKKDQALFGWDMSANLLACSTCLGGSLPNWFGLKLQIGAISLDVSTFRAWRDL